VPLWSITAKSVAGAMIEVFSRSALPYVILTDRGSQFVSKLMQELSQLLGIEHHPQTNGTIERMHATFEAMLTKAHQQGLDWAAQVPYALFALRQAPNRDTGLSPFELVFGRNVQAPLELVYQGWVHENKTGLDVCTWVEQVNERLMLMRDVAREKLEKAVGKRKQAYDKNACSREFKCGEFVLSRLPGMDSKLEEAWSGPLEVVERLNKVNYRVKEKGQKGRTRVVHVNNIKKWREREENVFRLVVVAEDDELEKRSKV